MATKNYKQVKVHGRYRSCEQSVTGNRAVPWLNVSGVWLEELGFKVGDQVRITTRDKLLIIEPLDENAQGEAQYNAVLKEVKQTLKKLVP